MDKEKIISITDATVAAYSNSPVWYKHDIGRYMEEYAKLISKEVAEKNESLNNQLEERSISIQAIELYKERTDFMQKRINELEDALIFIRDKMNPCSEVYKKADYILNPFR